MTAKSVAISAILGEELWYRREEIKGSGQPQRCDHPRAKVRRVSKG